MANATLFDFLFHRLVLRRVHFTDSNLACGLYGGVDVKRVWKLDCVRSCIDVIVVRVKVSSGIEPFSSMGTDSADTNQQPNGRICMDKSHILPNNPARQ